MTTTCSRTPRWPHRIVPFTFLESLKVRMNLVAKSIAQTHIHNGCPAHNTFSTAGYGTITVRGIMVCTSTYIIKTWSNLWRIIYLLMSSECIQIWLGTHSAKVEKNAPSRCRSSFPNGLAETQQLDSSWNVGNNAFVLIAHTAARTTNTFSMFLFALLTSRSTFDNAFRFRELANRRRYSPRYCWLSSHRFDLLVWGSIWDGTCNIFSHSFHSAGSISTIAGNRMVRISLRFYSRNIGSHTTLPFNLDGEENAGQYALFIGAGKSYTSFGCTGMQRCTKLKRITTIEVWPISQAWLPQNISEA